MTRFKSVFSFISNRLERHKTLVGRQNVERINRSHNKKKKKVGLRRWMGVCTDVIVIELDC